MSTRTEEENPRQWFAYVLRSSDARPRVYVGMTCNPARRLRQHNGEIAGGARRTRGGRPWAFDIVVAGFATARQAMQAEWRIKRARGDVAAAIEGRSRWTSAAPEFAEQNLRIRLLSDRSRSATRPVSAPAHWQWGEETSDSESSARDREGDPIPECGTDGVREPVVGETTYQHAPNKDLEAGQADPS